MLDTRKFGLSTRIIIGQLENLSIYIIIDRKSRIIMRDGLRIIRIVEHLKKVYLGVPVGLATNAAICSKTTAYLKENGVEVAVLEKM